LKKCSKCGIEKDASEYNKDSNHKDGLRSRCNDCRAVDRKKYRESHRDHILAHNKIYYELNKETISKKRRTNPRSYPESDKRYRTEHKELLKKSYNEWRNENSANISKVRKEWRDNNKEHIINYKKNWIENNKDRWNESTNKCKYNKRRDRVPQMTINDTVIIQKAFELRGVGLFVSEISKRLSEETGTKITQMALWRLFDSLKEEPQKELLESDYPSLDDYSYIFNKKFQKEKTSTLLTHDGITMRRDLMIRILNNYYKTEFTYNEVKKECNDRVGDENFLAHWKHLLAFHFIEQVDDYKFKFCDRVKKWKTFGQV